MLIAHRGCTRGPSKFENEPSFIKEALQAFDVEIDVWHQDQKWFLGHDGPEHQIDFDFLKNKGLWCHAKNLSALHQMLVLNVHCFWHQEDFVTLTSGGYVWTYPGQELISFKSIAVMPERVPGWDISNSTGICSDYVEKYL